MLELLTQLKQLGIEEKQARVYLACLEMGKATVQDLAQKSGVKRTSIYNFLEELKQSGLVTELHQGTRLFLVAENPNHLLHNLRERLKKMKTIIPELVSIYNLPENKPKVKYYEGQDGIFLAYENMMNSGETIYGYSDYEKMFTALSEERLLNMLDLRIKKKLMFYCLAKDGPKGRKLKAQDKAQLRETRFISNIELDTEINIFGNKVLLISFNSPYAAVLIEDRAIVMSLKSIWQINWSANTLN
ncbi:MAG: Transcriptional regulator, TrmB [Parcubacteria group bacterium GW2011_GWC2_39_14]|nr:MAG: Transcriptional regulator, TrmB [Parcubacteria group bacterium GW2011_GWC2_39_14]KKR53684.1 MAG: Transcriptional regulator, TrmB [Parcubacteria group bacterium GW2011_GWA2_40_23]